MMNRYPTFADLAAIVGVFVAVTLFVAALSIPLLRVFHVPQGAVMALSYLLSMGGTLVVVWKLREVRTPERWPISLRFNPAWLPAMGWALVMIAALGVVLEPLLALFPAEWYEKLSGAIGQGGWSVATAVVLAPILEEWLFRGIVQPPAVAKWGAFRGILVSAALFGVIHLMPMQVINAFFVGLVLGYLYYKTGSLVPVILLHALNNGVAMLQGADNPTMVREMIGSDALYYILYGVCLTLLVLGAIMMRRDLKVKENN